jgi:hypothetical protein
MTFYIAIKRVAQIEKYSSFSTEEYGISSFVLLGEEISIFQRPIREPNRIPRDYWLTTRNGLGLNPLPGQQWQFNSNPLTEPVAFRSSIWHRKGGWREPLLVRMRV